MKPKDNYCPNKVDSATQKQRNKIKGCHISLVELPITTLNRELFSMNAYLQIKSLQKLMQYSVSPKLLLILNTILKSGEGRERDGEYLKLIRDHETDFLAL